MVGGEEVAVKSSDSWEVAQQPPLQAPGASAAAPLRVAMSCSGRALPYTTEQTELARKMFLIVTSIHSVV